MLRALLFGLALLLGTEVANAFPLVGAVVAAIGLTGVAAAVATTVGVVALTVGVSYLVGKFLPRQQPGVGARGVELQLQLEPFTPEKLILGRAVVAGSRRYAETYGKRGETENSDMVEIIALADHPVTGLVKIYVDGIEVTSSTQGTITNPTQLQNFPGLFASLLNWLRNHATYGTAFQLANPLSWESLLSFITAQSISNATLNAFLATRDGVVDGYDNKVAYRFYDGTQTTADEYAVSVLHNHPDRPWTTNHVGRGRSYMRIHYIYEPEKVPGPLTWKMVLDGIKLYDPRKDSTVGGSGAHRFDNLATHEFSRNIPLFIYNILRGIRVQSETGLQHFYGLKNTPAANLPLDNWFARLNEADALGDDGNPTAWGGLEIPVSMPPMDAIRECLKATGYRLTEIGGIYKLHGEPGVPVLSFDDGLIPANRADMFEPITPLEQKLTYLTGKFLSVTDDYIEKDAPPRVDSTEEARIGQRVESDLTALMVQSVNHIQRLMKQLLLRAKRTRRHAIPIPPEAFGVEPGDVVAWTSTRNGYVNKLFEVTGAEYDPNLITNLQLLEIDPTDYDWSSGEIITQTPAIITAPRPSPKIIDEFSAVGFVHEGDGGSKRPAIRLFWVPPEDADVTGVAIQIRKFSEPDDVASFSIDTEDGVEAGEAIILAGLAPATEYEVRARFKSGEGFATAWSLWIQVTTPDVGVTEAELDTSIRALLQQVEEMLPNDLLHIRQDIDQIKEAMESHVTVIEEQQGRINLGVGEKFGTSLAAAELALATAADAQRAVAALFVDLFAQTAQGTAEGLIRFVAAAIPEGAIASFAIEVRSSFNEEFKSAGFYLDVGTFADSSTSRIRLVAERINLEDGEGLVLPALTFRAGGAAENTPITDGMITPDLSKQRLGYYTSITEPATYRKPTGGDSGYVLTHILEQDSVGHAVAFDTEGRIGGAPSIDTTPATYSVIRTTLIDKVKGLWSSVLEVTGAAGLILELTATATDNTDTTTYTFNGVSLGTAAADRKVILGIFLGVPSSNTPQVTGVTINGVAANLRTRTGTGTLDIPPGAIFDLNVPTGTSATIVITCGGGDTPPGCLLYVVTAKNYTGGVVADADFITAASTGTQLALSLDLQANGFAVYFGCGNESTGGTGVSWSGASEVDDRTWNYGGFTISRVAAATRKPTSTATVAETATWATTYEKATLIGASYT